MKKQVENNKLQVQQAEALDSLNVLLSKQTADDCIGAINESFYGYLQSHQADYIEDRIAITIMYGHIISFFSNISRLEKINHYTN